MAYSRIVELNDATPADDTYDMHDAGMSDDNGIPVWVSIAYWVTTADVTAGGYSISLEYVDPVGETRVVNGTPISLADATAFTYVPVFPIQRQSSSSLAQLVADLSGLAGSAKISARIKFSGESNENIGGFHEWTP